MGAAHQRPGAPQREPSAVSPTSIRQGVRVLLKVVLAIIKELLLLPHTRPFLSQAGRASILQNQEVGVIREARTVKSFAAAEPDEILIKHRAATALSLDHASTKRRVHE